MTNLQFFIAGTCHLLQQVGCSFLFQHVCVSVLVNSDTADDICQVSVHIRLFGDYIGGGRESF